MKQLSKTIFIFLLVFYSFLFEARAQIDTTFVKSDTVRNKSTYADSLTNQDAIYNRPFINVYKNALAIGGYMEANSNAFSTNGVSEGFSMEFRRFNIFLYGAIRRRIKFLSELEFEHGTKEINLETALLDFEIHPAFNFRAGIILPPIGGFNLNHDSPKWDIIDRPLVSTQLIPATLSEVGAGFHGKLFRRRLQFTYDFYITNGLGDNIILNATGRTSLQEGKSPEMFAADNNGEPMIAAKVAFKVRKIGEVGLSYYGGTYNTFRVKGFDVDPRRNLSIFAIDYTASVKKLNIAGEFAFIQLQRPASVGDIFGNKQWGGYLDLVYPLYSWTPFKKRREINTNAKFQRINRNLQNRDAVLSVVARLETVDFNVGKFSTTGENIRDEIYALTGGLSLRIAYNTVVRLNFRYHWIHDILGNPVTHRAGIQGGVTTYF